MVTKLLIMILVLILSTGCDSNKLEGPYLVTRVIDGDTIELNNSQIIRMSGIN